MSTRSVAGITYKRHPYRYLSLATVSTVSYRYKEFIFKEELNSYALNDNAYMPCFVICNNLVAHKVPNS